MTRSTAAAGTVIPGCQDGGCDARRTGRRPARRGHRSPRPGLRPGRRGHRQDAHDHPPHRVPRAHRARPARAGAGGHVHRAGGGRAAHPAARRSASAACRRAPSTPPRCASCATSAAGRRRPPWPSWSTGKLRLVGQAAARPRGCGTDARDAARPGGRDRVGQGRAWSRPADYPAAAAAAAPRRPGARRPGGRRLRRATSRPRPPPSMLDFADLLLLMAGAIEEHARRRRGVPRPLPPLRRRRVPGRLAAAAAAARRLARRPRRPCVVGDANQTIYTLRRGQPRATCSTSRGGSPRPWSSGCERDYRSTPQVVALANPLIGAARDRPAGTRLRLIGQRPPGPSPTSPSTTTSPPRPPPSPPGCRRLIADGVAAGRDRGAVPGQRPVRGLRAGARRGRRALRAARRRAVLRPARDPRGCALLPRGAARADERRRHWPTTCARCSRRVGLALPSPARRAAPRASGGSRCSRSSSWPRTCARVEPEADLRRARRRARHPGRRAQHAPTVQGVTLASLHSAKGLEWDAVFLVGLDRHHAADPARRRRRARSRRSAGCSTSASPAPASRLLLSWALARSPAARGGVGAAASSTGSCPSTTRRRGSPSANGAAPSRAAGSAGRR